MGVDVSILAQAFGTSGVPLIVARGDDVSGGVVVSFGRFWRRHGAGILSRRPDWMKAFVCGVNTSLARRIWTSARLLWVFSGCRVGLHPRRRVFRLFARRADFCAEV